MKCSECLYENADCIICAKARLAEVWNEFLKKVPIFRVFAKKIECPYFEKREKQ